MKLYFAGILLVVTSIVIFVDLNRKRTPQVNALVSEIEPIASRVDTPDSPLDANRISGSAPNAVTALLVETAGAPTVEHGTNVAEAQLSDARLLRARRDLSPRAESLITNQLARLGPKEEEIYNKQDWNELEGAKMEYLCGWATALLRFAARNGGMIPASLDQAAEFYPQDHAWLRSVFDMNRFESVYGGNLNDLRDPASVILVQERVPTVVQNLYQHWWKAYILGDGLVHEVAGFKSADEFKHSRMSIG